MQTLSRGERVQVTRNIESESESEDVVLTELCARRLGRVALEQAELLLHDLAERPVRDAVPIREAASGPP